MESLGNQRLDGKADQLLAGVAEDRLRLRVDERDQPGGIHHDHGVGRGFDDQAKSRFRLFHGLRRRHRANPALMQARLARLEPERELPRSEHLRRQRVTGDHDDAEIDERHHIGHPQPAGIDEPRLNDRGDEDGGDDSADEDRAAVVASPEERDDGVHEEQEENQVGHIDHPAQRAGGAAGHGEGLSPRRLRDAQPRDFPKDRTERRNRVHDQDERPE